MNPFKFFIILLYLTLRSTQTINTKQNGSFLSLLTGQSTPLEAELDATEDEEETENKGKGKKGGGSKGLVESLKSLFKHEDKTKSKVQNNVAMFTLTDFKNILNKKEVESSHIEVQTSSSILNNNSEKGVLHFSLSNNQLKDKGEVNKATLKMTKMFDAKPLGLKCKSNSVNLYLIKDPGEDNRLEVLKGPIKVDLKKNDLEVDVTKFFEDVEGPSGGSLSLLQFTDLSAEDPAPPREGEEPQEEGAEVKENQEPAKGDVEEDEDEEENEESESGTVTKTSGSKSTPNLGDLNKFLMLEADSDCYFAFDGSHNKPKVYLEMSKNIKTKIKGKVKVASIGIASAIVVVLLGVGGYFLKTNMKTDYTYFYDTQSNEIMAGGV